MQKLIVVLLAVAALASAQEGWVIPFAAAYHPDVAGFNAKFIANGLPEARGRHFGWGIEVRSLVKNFLIGPMYSRAWDDVENERFQLRTESSVIMGEVGLKLAPASFVSIVPMVGLGGMSQNYHLRAKTGELPLDSLLRSPGQTADILSGMNFAGMAALELGLAANTGGGQYGVAIRGGYLYSPMNINWHLANGAKLTGTPDSRMGGLFISVGVLIMPAAQTEETSSPYGG